ncbi:endolytic transglycosylase MltG [Bifidobacterium gallicum]|uniref:Endolytic murein transglycosylase n=2 Tax=Bifidobacterium gallicum DSM 20093 = LMG 11596 TaxID=561180 RepID=A0A087AIN5_9BIFI|nr:endolytic transglycosylase MltG [Bifidobacterium gallicum]KFI58635.1 membrane associated protein [Bifidobacterium gallicum DSM 20093 = LMG 11596]
MTDGDLHDFFEQNTTWDDGSHIEHHDDGHDGNGAYAPPRPPRSRRAMRARRKARQRHRIVAIVVSIAVLALLVVGGIVAVKALKNWQSGQTNQAVVDDYPGPGTSDVQFSVETGQGADQIAQNLVDAGIIKSAAAFTSVVAANHLTLYPGTFPMKLQMKASDAATILSNQGNAAGFLEVRPGERDTDVIANAAKVSGIPQEEFQKILDNKGSGILPAEANGSFEGWLEPGSYDVAKENDATQILRTMVEARIAKLDELGVPQGQERERLLIIASIAEAEVNLPEYYGKVTRVIDNRLAKDMTLGMDSTVAYGLHTTGNMLTNEQLADASNPYNTRVNKGLPPTPISNPGDNAIQAALHPEDGDWLYFVTVNLKTGETKFTDNDEQFQQYVQEYKTNNPDAS